MTQSGTNPNKMKPRRRRMLRLAVGSIVALTVAWLLFEHLVLRIDRYRPMVEEEIAKATGLPASIGSLDLDLLPTPRVEAHGVIVGESGFRATAERVTIRAALWPLLRRKIEVDSVEPERLNVYLPGDAEILQQRVEALVDELAKPPEKDPSFDVSVRLVRLAGGHIFFGNATEPEIVIDGNGTDILSDAVGVDLTALLPRRGDAELEANFNVAVVGGKIQALSGTASLSGLDATALSIEGAPEARLSAALTIGGTDPQFLEGKLTGTLESSQHPSLSGDYSGNFWWDHGKVTLNDFAWAAPGLKFAADGTRHDDGELVATIASLAVSKDALAALLEMATSKDFTVAAQDGANLTAADIHVGRAADGTLRIASGNASFEGIDVRNAKTEPVALAMRGHGGVVENLIRIEEVAGEGFSIKGTIHPDFTAKNFALDLSGEADLSRARLGAFLPDNTIRDVTGEVVLTRIAGTFPHADGLPADLAVQGHVKDAAFTVAAGDFSSVFSGVAADFATDDEGIQTNVQAASDRFGPLEVRGRYAFERKTWSGTFKGDVERAASSFLKNERDRQRVAPVLAQFGQSTIETSIVLAANEAKDIEIRAKREGNPPLVAAIMLNKKDDRYVLGTMDGEARIALDRLGEDTLPEGLRGRGDAQVVFGRDPAAARFDASADLTACAITYGDHIEKRAGDSLAITLAGEASEKTWQTREVAVDCLGVRVPLVIEGDRWIARNLDNEIDSLSRLLKDGATARGRVKGSIATAPFEADLELDSVAVAFDEDVRISSVTGGLSVRDGEVTARNLAIRGANSECIVNAGRSGEQWTGNVQGQKLDLEALAAMIAAAQSLGNPESTAGVGTVAVAAANPPEAGKPFTGRFDVAVEEVYYKRGRVDALRAAVVADAEGIHVRDLVFRPYSGTVSGAIDLLTVKDVGRVLAADLTLDNIDTRIFDEVLFEEPRHFFGAMSGKARFRAPWGETREMMKGMTGEAQWVAREGSFGSLGWATRILTALKSTDIFALKVPDLRDQGLTYTECTGTLVIENGLMTLGDSALEDTSYRMAAKGIVDFPLDSSNVEVAVQLLESVNRLAGRIPGLRELVETTTKLAALDMKVTGSPYDPKVDVSSRITPESITSGGRVLRDAAEAAGGLLRRLVPKKD